LIQHALIQNALVQSVPPQHALVQSVSTKCIDTKCIVTKCISQSVPPQHALIQNALIQNALIQSALIQNAFHKVHLQSASTKCIYKIHLQIVPYKCIYKLFHINASTSFYKSIYKLLKISPRLFIHHPCHPPCSYNIPYSQPVNSFYCYILSIMVQWINAISFPALSQQKCRLKTTSNNSSTQQIQTQRS